MRLTQWSLFLHPLTLTLSRKGRGNGTSPAPSPLAGEGWGEGFPGLKRRKGQGCNFKRPTCTCGRASIYKRLFSDHPCHRSILVLPGGR